MTLDEFIKKALLVPFKTCGRDYEGWDCYGLIHCAFNDVYGVDLPEYLNYSYQREYEDLKKVIDEEKQIWKEVKDPRAGDVALYSMRSRSPHVALVINKRQALHSDGNVGTFIENLSSAVWVRRIEGFYRIKK